MSIISKWVSQQVLAACMIVICCYQVVASEHISKINLAVLANSEKEAGVYAQLVDSYHSMYPNREVKLIAQADARYKVQFKRWLISGQMDVLYWQAGQHRLMPLIELDLLVDLTHVWQENNLDKLMQTSVKPLMSKHDRYFAIPYTYYQWGMFYNKSLFERLNLKTPANIQDYLVLCRQLVGQDIVAIGLGIKDKWPLLAWFEYVNLRMHGLDYHRQLVSGQSSFDDDRVRAVLEKLDEVFSSCSHNNDYRDVSWELVAGSIARGEVATMLIGNFIQQVYTDDALSKIGFFPFPMINPKYPRFEIAPLDVWIGSKASKNKGAITHFLTYAADPVNLGMVNEALKYFSPLASQNITGNHLSHAGGVLLSEAQGISQYFDRDASAELLHKVTEGLLAFMQDKDANKMIASIEAGRKK